MSDIAIRVENLGEQYPSTKPRAGRIGGPAAPYETLRESISDTVTAPFRRLSSVARGPSSAVSDEAIWAPSAGPPGRTGCGKKPPQVANGLREGSQEESK